MSLWTPSVVRLTSMLHPSLQLLHCCHLQFSAYNDCVPSLQLLHCCHLQFSAYNDCVPLSPVYRCPCCAQAAGHGSRSAGGSSWGTVAALYRALT